MLGIIKKGIENSQYYNDIVQIDCMATPGVLHPVLVMTSQKVYSGNGKGAERSDQIITWLGHLLYEKRLQSLGFLSLKKTPEEDFYCDIQSYAGDGYRAVIFN